MQTEFPEKVNLIYPYSFIRIQIKWADEHMFEIEITASNKLFSGSTAIYEFPESITNLALRLEGYPKSNNPVLYQNGPQNTKALCYLNFYPFDGTGRVGVDVKLEREQSVYTMGEETSTVNFKLIVLPSTIDKFQRELLNLAHEFKGQAILFGEDYIFEN